MKIAAYTAYGTPGPSPSSNVRSPCSGPGEGRMRVRAAPVTTGGARLRLGKVPRGLWG